MEKPEILFKRNYSIIKKTCYSYSRYFNLDYEDLLSIAHESFVLSYHKYKHDKISFDRFMLFFLINDIKNYKKREKLRQIKQLMILNEPFFIEKHEKNEINLKNNIKKVINDIISFLLLPNFKDYLSPFYKNKKYNNNKIPIYAIQKYFITVKNYTYTEIIEAFEGIKMILREDLI